MKEDEFSMGFNVVCRNYGNYTTIGKLLNKISFNLFNNYLKRFKLLYKPAEPLKKVSLTFGFIEGNENEWKQVTKDFEVDVPAESSFTIPLVFDENDPTNTIYVYNIRVIKKEE